MLEGEYDLHNQSDFKILKFHIGKQIKDLFLLTNPFLT